jgi:hypothetical protein
MSEPFAGERLRALLRMDDALAARGQFVTVTVLIESGAEQSLVTIDRGRVTAVAAGPFVMPAWTFALRADEDAWRRFWSAPPAPGFHDLFALLRGKRLRIEGDLHPFMSNLLYFKDLLALPVEAR